jgi:Flp pilus assembly protein TadG
MNHSKHEKGQALIIIVLAIFGLVGLTGLTIDGGNVYSDRRHAQNAADAAAYAAALTMVRDGDWQAAGLARAADNDYDNNGTTNTVQVVNPPISGTYAGNSDYIQVLITSHVDTYFAPVLGIHQLTNQVQAVSKTKLSGIGPLFDGQAMVSLKPDDDYAFYVCGNADLNVENSGVFVNSSDECAMVAQGNVTVDADTGYAIVNSTGPLCEIGGPDVLGPLAGGAEQIDYPPNIDLPAPSITCDSDGTFSESGGVTTYQPGNYPSGITINSSANFSPGNYCLDGNLKINGGDTTANFASFKFTDGEFSLNGNATFTGDHVVFYCTDDCDGIHFNGNGTVTSDSTTFFLETGDVEWNGGAENTLTAPTTGPNAGMLIYMPYGSTNTLKINGNADSLIQGTILGTSAHIEVTGNSSSNSINSQIIGYTVESCGNGDLNIIYNAGDNYEQQEPAKIELTE